MILSAEMAANSFKVSSFTAVGHLLHINLKDHLIHSKASIGEALLKKNPRMLAVVNKVNTIDNTYRNFDIEIIAKRDDCNKTDEELMLVEVNENKCRFQFDFSKVYWNSRLSTEHERIINKFNRGIDIVFDLFAGVGPFSVPAAKYRCKTYANDLNPESVKWLNVNMKRNKVVSSNFEVFNMDSKDFIQNVMKSKLCEEYEYIEKEELATMPKVHIIMNLPALAPSFLSLFNGLLKVSKEKDMELMKLIRKQSLEHIIYCYCFLKGSYDDPKAQVKELIEENFGRKLTDRQVIDIFRVRNVAPYKEMYRVDIRLDETILFDLKPPVSIIKNGLHSHPSSASKKQVTIRTPAVKRAHLDSSESSNDDQDQNSTKRPRLSEYCVIS